MRHLLLAAALLMPIPSRASGTPPSPTTLAQLRDAYRPLLIFAPKPDDPGLLAQMHRLKDAAPGLDTREVLLIAIPFDNPSPTDVNLTPADALAARRRFGIAPAEFTVILLGKDGGEKLRCRNPVSFEKLRDLIDSMPMRQDEVRDRQSH